MARLKLAELADAFGSNATGSNDNKIAPLSTDIESLEIYGKAYLIPDTNEFINHMDIFEKPELKNIIVLQTVLDEVKNLSIQTHNRIRNLLKDHGLSRNWYVFLNEHHKETYQERLPEESPNDRNDREATKWYENQLVALDIKIILITEDADNRKKAKELGLEAINFETYLKNNPNCVNFLDMIGITHIEADKDYEAYIPYLSELQIKEGLKAGFLIQGTLDVSPFNYLEASIFGIVKQKNPLDEIKIYIQGRLAMNRAISGDKVVVKLLPKSEWKKAPEAVIMDEDEDVVGNTLNQSILNSQEKIINNNLEEINRDTKRQKLVNNENKNSTEIDSHELSGDPTAVVVGVIRRNWRQYCCFLDPNMEKMCLSIAPGTPTNVFMLPMDRKVPKIKIRTRRAKELIGKRALIALDSWPTNTKYPLGHFVKTIGTAGDQSTETEVLLLEHDVPYEEFSASVLENLPAEGENWIFDPVRDGVANGSRKDIRHINVCSIDPPGCTDIDDALHCTILDNGNFQVGVHIADVTNFVKQDSTIDKEASNRCTTVYLVNKRIDMLPGLLGTNLCSLRSNVDRLAFSCVWELDKESNIVNVDFFKSVIRSKASFTYEEAQSRIDDETMQDDITISIRSLNTLAKKLKAKRIANGALTLMSPEVRFKLENDSQDPLDVEMKELKETNSLVEEFMLLANISVSKQIYSKFPDKALLRRHPEPPQANFAKLEKSLQELNISLQTETSLDLANSLNKAILENDSYFNTLVRILTTRCMLQAMYFSSGSLPESEYRHYGLATDIYTHFTSPIRRYSDIMVHRLLAISIGFDSNTILAKMTASTMSEQCNMLNKRHRMAQYASRASVELFTNLFFRNKVVIQDGYVTQILQNGFSVLIPQYGIEGIVYTLKPNQDNKINSSIIEYCSESNSLKSSESGEVCIKLFQKVKIAIEVDDKPATANVSSMRRKLLLQLIEPSIEGLSVEEEKRKELLELYTKSSKNKNDDNIVNVLIEKIGSETPK
ncbi:hypothetical protein BB561_001545 [Smittium simulii]|uniref:Ribosomal RNA-processing protein 44 n=1 Tax=Smittium simulii TaxID=133385 RepID=A0A2T9YU89_9FUNG|nr:hypothetical protein BB561_001545 [Smittium simulii]